MTIKEKIQKRIKQEYSKNKLGCYDSELERLTPYYLKKVFDGLSYGDSTDVDIKIDKQNYVVEISYVDNEVDFSVITKQEYISRYGNERYEK